MLRRLALMAEHLAIALVAWTAVAWAQGIVTIGSPGVLEFGVDSPKIRYAGTLTVENIGGSTAPWLFPSINAGTPSIAFGNATSGIASSSAGNIRLLSGGNQLMSMDTGGVLFTNANGIRFTPNNAPIIFAAGVAPTSPGVGTVAFNLRAAQVAAAPLGVGTAANDCVLVGRLSSGTEFTVAVAVTDGACP